MRRLPHLLPSAATAVSLVCLVVGCTGTLRDDRGTVRDARFAAAQARGLAANAPLLIPFVPVGVVGNGVKASVENGRVTLAGAVVDESGAPLSGVTMRVAHSRLVTFDLNDDSPVFWEESRSRTVDGTFSVDLLNTHTVRLEFKKEGYESRDFHFEVVRKGGRPWDQEPATTRPVYGRAPAVQSGLRVVMKRQGPRAPSTRPAASPVRGAVHRARPYPAAGGVRVSRLPPSPRRTQAPARAAGAESAGRYNAAAHETTPTPAPHPVERRAGGVAGTVRRDGGAVGAELCRSRHMGLAVEANGGGRHDVQGEARPVPRP